MQNPRQPFARLVDAHDHDPFAVLGAHPLTDGWCLRTWQPGATAVGLMLDGRVVDATRVHAAGVFEARVAARPDAPLR